MKKLPLAAMDTLKTSYYVRLAVVDKPGVLASITGIFRDEGISMCSFLQHSRRPEEAVQVVITTHETVELAMRNALKSIARLGTVKEPPHMIRIENL
jgi:homoserine dehydrogenase